MNLRGLLLALAIGAFAHNDATATTFRELTAEQRADLSDLIVRGEVVETWVERDENGRYWTRAQLEVSRVIKGDADMDVVVIDQIGGTWGNRTLDVSGAARFGIGEDILVFLEVSDKGFIRPVGMTMGKYTVRLDPVSREQIVQRFTVPVTEEWDHRFIPAPQDDARLFLADFEQRIVAHVAKETK